MDGSDIIETIMRFGLEYFKVFPGFYRGVVARTDDPEKRGRIQVDVPTVNGANRVPNVWIKPAFFGAGAKRGWFWPPDVGDTVYVAYRNGHPGRPELYLGGWFGWPDQVSDVPDELGYAGDEPEKRGLRTRAGHYFVFNDETGEESVELVWNQEAGRTDDRTISAASSVKMSLKFTKDGDIEITDKESQRVVLKGSNKSIRIEDAHGNRVVLDSEGVLVHSDKKIKLGDNADTEAMRFKEWELWAKNHTHPTNTGPSGKPTVPPSRSIASSLVELK